MMKRNIDNYITVKAKGFYKYDFSGDSYTIIRYKGVWALFSNSSIDLKKLYLGNSLRGAKDALKKIVNS